MDASDTKATEHADGDHKPKRLKQTEGTIGATISKIMACSLPPTLRAPRGTCDDVKKLVVWIQMTALVTSTDGLFVQRRWTDTIHSWFSSTRHKTEGSHTASRRVDTRFCHSITSTRLRFVVTSRTVSALSGRNARILFTVVQTNTCSRRTSHQLHLWGPAKGTISKLVALEFCVSDEREKSDPQHGKVGQTRLRTGLKRDRLVAKCRKVIAV